MDLLRMIRHMATPPWTVRRALPAAALAELTEAVRAGESRHRGEVRVAIEAALNLGPLLRGQSARQRALEVFSELKVWDTEENNGVLIYLLLADRRVEVVADRGINERLGAGRWAELCASLEKDFSRGAFKEGLLAALRVLNDLLAAAYPASARNPNELPDQPEIIT